MTNIGSLTGVNISTAVYDHGIIEAAKACLEGETGDYYFFQYDASHYVLVVSDDVVITPTTFDASDCLVTVFEAVTTRSPYVVSVPVSGSIGGTMGGGYFQGSGQLTQYSETTVYYAATSQVDSVSVRNPSFYLTYSSFQGYPHLIEGVQNYAVAAFILCFIILCFKLIDRIFRRVY